MERQEYYEKIERTEDNIYVHICTDWDNLHIVRT